MSNIDRLDLVSNTPRKILRYLMFSKKNNIKLDNSILGEKEDAEVIKYFEKHNKFTNWDDFETKWDIGIGDDIIAQANRKEKWFLFDSAKEDIVFRPEDYWESEARRKNTSTHALFTQECNQRGITMEEFFKTFF